MWCPTEIIAFSDRAKEFQDINAEVIACSVDSQFTHLAWINTPRSKGGLGPIKIPLLGLFIIDPKGILRQITMNDLPVGRSVDETLRLVQAFQYTDPHGEVCPAGWKPGNCAKSKRVSKIFQKAWRLKNNIKTNSFLCTSMTAKIVNLSCVLKSFKRDKLCNFYLPKNVQFIFYNHKTIEIYALIFGIIFDKLCYAYYCYNKKCSIFFLPCNKPVETNNNNNICSLIFFRIISGWIGFIYLIQISFLCCICRESGDNKFFHYMKKDFCLYGQDTCINFLNLDNKKELKYFSLQKKLVFYARLFHGWPVIRSNNIKLALYYSYMWSCLSWVGNNIYVYNFILHMYTCEYDQRNYLNIYVLYHLCHVYLYVTLSSFKRGLPCSKCYGQKSIHKYGFDSTIQT
ncbi:hypothetical protein KUTeg_002711 [Tegillarca granosa]|uniref:thioredoxin-dependent peroxiredoxin n=1 Tax=Tegillarca granosa TaxID=220873 RepID=A0ABQ9FUC7_TEGGR|nr:hypothetical protein KUTeg_002711 [Tegillarca granosa]